MDTNEIEVKFFSKIKKNNDPKYILKKVFFTFSLILCASLVLGMLFCKISVSSVSDAMKIQIASHFIDVFDGCRNPTDYFAVIITASNADFRYLVLVFTVGFTYFCKYAAFALVGVRGFSVGYSIAFLFMAIKEEALCLRYPSVAFLLFLFSKIILLILLVYLAVKASLFCDDFHKLRGRKSLMLRSPVIYRYAFFFLTALGFVIIVNAGYCVLFSIF